MAVLGDEAVAETVLDRWESVLHGLETDPSSLSPQLDWVAKRQLIEAYRDRHGCDWDDDRLAALDLQYHDLRPERSLYARLGMERLVERRRSGSLAVTEPPRRHPGLVPGPVPGPLARGGGHRQLGFARLRPGRGPAPPRPYDGPTQGNGRPHGGLARGERQPGGACWSDLSSREGTETWQNVS